MCEYQTFCGTAKAIAVMSVKADFHRVVVVLLLLLRSWNHRIS